MMMINYFMLPAHTDHFLYLTHLQNSMCQYIAVQHRDKTDPLSLMNKALTSKKRNTLKLGQTIHVGKRVSEIHKNYN